MMINYYQPPLPFFGGVVEAEEYITRKPENKKLSELDAGFLAIDN
jgi:hypothetical protein